MAQLRIPVSFDVKSVNPKFLGPFTKRQAVCFSLAAILGFSTYRLSRVTLPQDLAIVCTVFVAIACFAFLYEKNLMFLEQIIFNYVRWKFIFPQTRIKEGGKAVEKSIKRKKDTVFNIYKKTRN